MREDLDTGGAISYDCNPFARNIGGGVPKLAPVSSVT